MRTPFSFNFVVTRRKWSVQVLHRDSLVGDQFHLKP